MKKIILLLAGVIALALSSTAVEAKNYTNAQFQAQLGGAYCAGSTCTKQSETSSTVDNPDISTQVLVSPAEPDRSSVTGDAYGPCGAWGENVNGMLNPDGTPFCVTLDSHRITGQSGPSPVYQTIVTDGGTTTVVTCTTTTLDTSYHPNRPNKPWTIKESASSSSGAC